MKYIIACSGINEAVILFGERVGFLDMVAGLGDGVDIVAAGYCYMTDPVKGVDGLETFGGAITLVAKPREEDADLIKRFLRGG